MSERKPCVDCNRTIDAIAKSCPFCGWDQREEARPKSETSSPTPVEASPLPVPPRERVFSRIPRRILTVVGGAAGLVIVFVIGALVHGHEPDAKPAAPTSTINAPRAEAAPPAHGNIELVPTGTSAQDAQQPITSAPVASNDGSMADPYARDDATALPQSDYAQLAQRAQPKGAQTSTQFTDPRSITGGVEGAQQETPRPRRAAPPVQSTTVARTEPVAVYQPVPSMHLGTEATARLFLTVGADGRVKDIDIARALPGDTARLIGAVQEWRFRPATENGVPVASRFSVDITFHANE